MVPTTHQWTDAFNDPFNDPMILKWSKVSEASDSEPGMHSELWLEDQLLRNRFKCLHKRHGTVEHPCSIKRVLAGTYPYNKPTKNNVARRMMEWGGEFVTHAAYVWLRAWVTFQITARLH